MALVKLTGFQVVPAMQAGVAAIHMMYTEYFTGHTLAG